MGFHVVTAGRVWIHPPAPAEPLALAAGDIAFMARGCVHVLATAPRLEGLVPQPVAGTWGAAALVPSTAAAAPQASVISGADQLWHTPLATILTRTSPNRGSSSSSSSICIFSFGFMSTGALINMVSSWCLRVYNLF
jgi:hypothetical protein